MRAKNIHNYKIIDITELPGKEWSAADKVLGLDESDKVVMVEPEGAAVTPEYVDNAIDQAIEAETVRTESVYAKKSALDNYATVAELDAKIAEELARATASENEISERINNLFYYRNNTLYLNNE